MQNDTENLRQVREGMPLLLDRLWRFAFSLTRKADEADDLVQSTCIRALERAHQFRSDTRLDRWSFTIMASIWRNEVRKRSRHATDTSDQLDMLEGASGDEIATNILSRQVLTAISALSEAQRASVVLVYMEGYAYREAAEILEVPIGTIMSRLATARKALAPLMSDEQSEKVETL